MKNFSEYEDGLNQIKSLKRKSYRHYILDVEHSNHLIFIEPSKEYYPGGVDAVKDSNLVFCYYSYSANFNILDVSDKEYWTPFLNPVSFEYFFDNLPADAKLEFSFHLDLFLG